MNFEDIQKTWRSQDEGFQMTMDSALLLREVRRNQRYFTAMIFWRDFRECFIALLLTAFFLFFGFKFQLTSSIFMSVMVIFVGAFIVGDRIYQRKKNKRDQATLRDTIEVSLQGVLHQIWLLKNVFWWYLLPLAVGAATFYGEVIRIAPPKFEFSFAGNSLFATCGGILFAILVFWGVYKLNQAAVRQELLPRKKELETLLANLTEHT